MKKIISILSVLLVLFVLIGTASAIGVSDFKLPTGFKEVGSNFANTTDFGLAVIEYTGSDKDVYFKNDSDYTVNIGDISNYTDKLSKQVGCIEVVDVNGEKVVVEIYQDGMSKQGDCYKHVLEFNKLNNLKPIAV